MSLEVTSAASSVFRERVKGGTRSRPPPVRPSAAVADWSRERFGSRSYVPGIAMLRALRDYQAPRNQGGALLPTLRRKLAVLRHRFWSVVAGSDIPLNCRHLGGGLLLPHPQGIVLHPEVQLGPNCTLFQQVTLGGGPIPGYPVLGGAVDVGPGAKVLGGVKIGDGARIGANAVVLSDVPAGAIAVGIPAAVKMPRWTVTSADGGRHARKKLRGQTPG